MIRTKLCDCPKHKTFIYFCIQQRCILNRRLCADCFKDHKEHEMILIQNQQSLRSYTCNRKNTNFANVLIQINNTIQATIAVKDKVILQFNKFIQRWKNQFDKHIKDPLEMLKRTSEVDLRQEKNIAIYKENTTKEQLSQIAMEIRALNRAYFQQKQSIISMRHNLTESLKSIIKDLHNRFSADQYFKPLEQLNPFSLKWIKLIKKQQQDRLNFLKQYGKVIKDNKILQSAQQWKSKGKNLFEIQQFCFNDKNIQAIPQQLKLFPNLKHLQFSKNKIKKINNLQNLKKLESLGLCNNQIGKIQNLQEQSNLKHLDLGNNQINKLTLKNMNQLARIKILWLYNNPLLENQSERKKIEQMKKKGGVNIRVISRNI